MPTFCDDVRTVEQKLQLAESKINRMRELRIGTNETDLFVEQALYFQFCPEVRGYIMSAEVGRKLILIKNIIPFIFQ